MDITATVLIGGVIGLSSGMFGIGGALLATPMLSLWLGLLPKIAVASPLPAAIPSAISGSIAYGRKGLIRFDTAWRLLLPAIPMTVVGAYVNDLSSDSVLLVGTGIVLSYSAWTFLRRGLRNDVSAAPRSDAASPRFGAAAFGAGAFAGFLSGFLAIGGGIVMVPLLIRIVGMETKEAIATSLFCVAALAAPGVVVHAMSDHIDWGVALTLAAVVVPFSYLGARIATRLANRTLEIAYGSAMLIFALYFIVRNL